VEKIITLPSQDELKDRLWKISGHELFQKELFPSLLHDAGTSGTAPQIVTMLLVRLYYYAAGKAREAALAALIHVPVFIEALIPDEEGCKEALAFWDEAVRFRG
jgi:hypothetical protein